MRLRCLPVSSDSTGVTGYKRLWAPSAPCAAPEQPLPAPLARPRAHAPGLRCTEPPHSLGGQTGLSARRWVRGDGSSSGLPAELLLQETGIATWWGAGSGTSSGRTGRDQHPKTRREEEGAGAQSWGPAEATHDCRGQF